jgi:type I restriction enzyme S subunit
MTKTKNTKPFYNTEIPGDWEIKKLGDLGKVVSGLTYSPDDICEETGVLVLRSSNVQGGQITFDDNVFVKVKERDFNPVVNGDILICVRNGSKSLIGKCALINEKAAGLAFGAFMAIYRGKYNNYLIHVFNTDIYNREIHRNLGATINSINGSDLKEFKIPLPPLPEQKAIAQVLSTADVAIHTTEKIIAQKVLRKKWLMQQLLTGKKRLKGFENTKWKIQPLENFIKPIVREVPKPSTPYLGIGLRSHGKGTFLKHDEQPEKNSMDNFYVVRPNDLIVNITFAWEQAIAIVRPEDDGALASHRFPTYTFIEDKGHPDFFRFYILQPRMKFMLQMISPGGAGRNRVMSKSDFIKLEFLLPDYKEQTAIAQVLQSADKEISLLKAKAEKLREQKKGLMQVLLTGKVRLKIN